MITHGIRRAGKINIEPPVLRVFETAHSCRRSLPTRKPQSKQSVPMLHTQYSAPGPPSSHSPSDAVGQFWDVTCDEQPDDLGAQSTQSVPRSQVSDSAPLPPSSHSPLPVLEHMLLHKSELEDTGGEVFCALVGLKPRRENVISTNLCTLCPLTERIVPAKYTEPRVSSPWTSLACYHPSIFLEENETRKARHRKRIRHDNAMFEEQH